MRIVMYSREIAHVSYVHHGSLDVPATAEKSYESAKTYLCKDAVERRLFYRLEHAHSHHYTLAVNHRNDDHYDPNTNTIAWDPYSALRTTGGGRQSPALGLGHEVDHAVENARIADRLRNTHDAQFDTAEEHRVIMGSEAHAARTLGEGVRHNHGGATYRVASPVAR